MANVVSINIKEAPSEYEAFYYEYYNITKDKTYGGKRKGFVGDGYKHSSKNPEMHEDFQNLDMEWEYRVLHYGTDEYILNKERDILKSNEARKSDKWYNLTNGGEAYPHPNVSKIHNIVDNITAGVYYVEDDKINEEQLEELVSDDSRYQVRTEEDEKRETEIATEIDDIGDTRNCDPITLLENRNGDGKHSLIDGNTTAQGILKSKHGLYAEYNLIPYNIHKNLTNGDLDQLGLLLNPRNKKRKWESTTTDWATSIARASIEENRPIRCQENRDNLKKSNFNSSQISSIFNQAEDLAKMGNLAKGGTPWIKYKLAKNKPLLDKKESEILTKYPNTMIYTFSSEKFRWEDVMFGLIDNDKLKIKEQKKEIRVIIHYPKPSSEAKWNKGLSKVDDYMRAISEKFGVTFKGFTYMDTI